jgi:hypothetical protein
MHPITGLDKLRAAGLIPTMLTVTLFSLCCAGMPMPHRDSKGFYRALLLEPDASQDQVQLAYEMLCELPEGQAGPARTEIERAYTVLSHPTSRLAYDRLETTPPVERPKLNLNLNNGRLLAACVGLLLVILVVVWVPLYGSRFRSFSTGDQVTDLSGRSFGTIVQSDERHLFPGGVAAPGFLVELSGTKQLRWYPVTDLQATCRRVR